MPAALCGAVDVYDGMVALEDDPGRSLDVGLAPAVHLGKELRLVDVDREELDLREKVSHDHLVGVRSHQDFAFPGDERDLGQDRVVFVGSEFVCHELDRSRVPDDAQGNARRLALLETVIEDLAYICLGGGAVRRVEHGYGKNRFQVVRLER